MISHREHTKWTAETSATNDNAFSCAFVRHDCTHDFIFSDVYLRTNRTNHTKIMRCFPHCCPDHRQRSYCGSPIHFELTASSPLFGTRDLVVYARFRPHNMKPLAPGDHVTVTSIHSSLQKDDPSQGEWVESKLIDFNTSKDKHSWLFEVNPSGRWYYPWSGAATIAMRATEHVFEALAFCDVGKGILEFVGSAQSPNFRLMSFRRGVVGGDSTKTTSSQRERHHKRSTKRSVYSTRAATPTADKAVTSPAVSKRVLHKTVAPMHLLEPRYSPSYLRPIDGLDRRTDQQEHSRLPHVRDSSPSPDPQPITSTLGLLLSWLHDLPASSIGSKWIMAWERIIQDTCDAHLRAAHSHGSGVRGSLVPILSALHVAITSPLSSSPGPSKPTLSPMDTIDAVVRVLLHLWLDVDCVRASDAGIQRFRHITIGLHSHQLSIGHTTWLRDTEARGKRYLHAQKLASWEHLTTMGASHQAHWSGDEFSYRSFVAQWRQQLIHQDRTTRENARRRKRQRTGQGRFVPVGLAQTSRLWTSSMEDVSVEQGVVTPSAVSLLMVLQFWRHLSCIRLDCSANVLSLASVFNSTVVDGGFTRLVLDGKHRWFDCLPSGGATTGTTLMGYVIGDYVGSVTRDGTLHVTTYFWPSDVSGPRDHSAYAWHWIIDSTSLSTEMLAINIVIDTALIQHAYPLNAFETISISEKLQSIGRWHHVCRAQLTYQAQ